MLSIMTEKIKNKVNYYTFMNKYFFSRKLNLRFINAHNNKKIQGYNQNYFIILG